MSEQTAILARGVTKRFPENRGGATLFRRLFSSNGGGRLALGGVDLEVRRGELVGLVGDNGAGKTTLLKTIAGLYHASAGSVECNGRALYLAGLGVGMMGKLSVRRNLYLYGAICGLSRRRLDEIFQSALDWAELTAYAEAPVRTLSQGMKARLAFSVARHIEAEIVLMDEAFAAGDERFRGKTEAFFHPEVRGQRAIIVSTHVQQFVRDHCTRAIWLRSGLVADSGDPETILAQYNEWTHQRRSAP